MQTIKARKKAK